MDGALRRPALLTSELQLAGRRFEPTSERSLDPSLILAASTLQVARNRPTFVLAECPLPFGVPDAVVLAADDAAFQARLDSNIPALSGQADARIVVAAQRRSRSLSELIEISQLSAPVARRYIQRLQEWGALEGSHGRYRGSDTLRPAGRVFALEAKVSDWRAGCEQCLRYGSFADGTVLVLPRVTERTRGPLLETARRHGIGVFAADRWLVRPRMSRHPKERRLQASESVIAALGLVP